MEPQSINSNTELFFSISSLIKLYLLIKIDLETFDSLLCLTIWHNVSLNRLLPSFLLNIKVPLGKFRVPVNLEVLGSYGWNELQDISESLSLLSNISNLSFRLSGHSRLTNIKIFFCNFSKQTSFWLPSACWPMLLMSYFLIISWNLLIWI